MKFFAEVMLVRDREIARLTPGLTRIDCDGFAVTPDLIEALKARQGFLERAELVLEAEKRLSSAQEEVDKLTWTAHFYRPAISDLDDLLLRSRS